LRDGRLKVAITGATGFIGAAVTNRLLQDGQFDVRAAVRNQASVLPSGVERIEIGNLTPNLDWNKTLSGVNAVVHLAARVHVMHDTAEGLFEFRRMNVESTLNLARQAAAAGVSRFIFLSTVKVNGESGVYTERDNPSPQDAYAVSKHEAEIGLRRIADQTGIEIATVRPPLVYGPGVKANFRALMLAVRRGIPLPLGAVRNRRSLVALDNLADFVLTCIRHPAAGNQTFLVSDGEDLSTTDLIRRLARAMGRPVRLIPVPAALLMAAASVLGKRDLATRLLGSLQVDTSKAREILGWTPPISVDEGLRRAANALE